ncbi:ROK family protein [Kribbella sp. GL6]|uniref:ROK family protein n=1 Tax=Kribbella sp. GL6 TaxID=3419765 RepID=UPI003CFF44D9
MVDSTKLSGENPALLRRINRSAVLRALDPETPQTMAELVTRVGLSRRTVEDSLAELLAEGWASVAAAAAGDASTRSAEVVERRAAGRPARRFRFRAEAGRVAGIDLGAARIECLVTDLSGTILDEAAIEADPGWPAERRLSVARELLTGTLASGTAPLLSLGVGTTGIVDAGRIMLSTALPDWTGFDVAGALRAAVDCPVLVENDGNVAAIAERWLGAATDVPDVLLIHAGRRITAGVVIDGRLHLGRHRRAGEVGTMPMLHWERILTDLAAMAQPHTTGGRRPPRPVFAEVARDLAVGVAAMALTLDPDVVVLGGQLSALGAGFRREFEAALATHCPWELEVRNSTLGGRGVSLGAVRLALDEVESRLYAVDGADRTAGVLAAR